MAVPTRVTIAREEATRVAEQRPKSIRKPAGRWWRFVLAVIITAVVLIPVAAVVLLALKPDSASSSTSSVTFRNFSYVFSDTQLLTWLANSLKVTLSTVVVSVLAAAPAGYVISRSRSRTVATYSQLLFFIQALPVITTVIPLFILFAKIGLVDNLLGLGIIYVGASVSVAAWMMAAYIDTIPRSLEEAAWVDGCSPFKAFFRIVIRNSFPGILSTAIFTFLVSWNDYLIASVFIRTDTNFTLPIGMESFFQQYQTDWGSVMAVAVVMMAPPILIFAVLNKYLRIGGIGGALTGE